MLLPVRRITNQQDLELFRQSSTKHDILQFVSDLSESVKGQTNDSDCEITPIIQNLLDIIDKVSELVEKHPAKDSSSSRFGKEEFRDFYDDLNIQAPKFLDILCENSDPEALIEIGPYFVESWGNRTRIDYGSGHELNFMSFLLCLHILGELPQTMYKAIVLRVFLKYLGVMRKIQTTYWLEPAGSHGVWGLDDYHFLPFLFGSSQLSTHKHLRPNSIHDQDILEMYSDKYMYLACIKFINSVKSASLRWHSPMLDDISGVKKWSKVNEGMIKMFDAEVLGKLPIMQHFMFGSLLPAATGITPAALPGTELPHVHSHWADCCGIKVPSAIAANVMGRHDHNELRPVAPGLIPFD